MRFLSCGIIVLMAMAITAPATAIPIHFHYINDDVVADGTLDVEAGLAVSGGGTISGGGLIGVLSMTYIYPGAAPSPLSTSPATGCNLGGSSCYNVQTFSCGCSFVNEDAVFNVTSSIAVDANGIAFQVGGSTLNYGFGLYDAGDGTVGEILAGNQIPQPDILNGGTAGGTLEYNAVPEPASVTLLGIGLMSMRIAKRVSKDKLS